MRRYNRWWSRFDQPDPFDGSYNLTDPQSLNRYAYVQNDPVNFVDPSGLIELVAQPDYSALLSLIFGRREIDRVLESPVETQNPTPAPIPPQVTPECQSALNAINKNSFAIQRAYEAANILNQAGDNNILPPRLLAAIGIRESGFENLSQRGGQGRGVFQIDLGQHPNVTEAQALDVAWSANYAAGLLSKNIITFLKKGYSPQVSIAAGIHAYNSGYPSRVLLKKASRGNINALDAGTTGSNYVSNVLALWNHCFPD